MKAVQNCYVCGGAGYLVDGPIELPPGEWEGPPSIGQCPRCHRFICVFHGEPLAAKQDERRGLFRKRGPEGPRTVGCPFDPGVALGGAGPG
jgi:hypothetical protein